MNNSRYVTRPLCFEPRRDEISSINRECSEFLQHVVSFVLQYHGLIVNWAFFSTLLLVFAGIVQAIEKLQKVCIIKFTEKEMHIICNGDANEGGIQVWS